MYYCGVMLLDVLNLVFVFGYINVFWIFKVDFVLEYVCCIFNYMVKYNFIKVVFELNDWSVEEEIWFDFIFGYV